MYLGVINFIKGIFTFGSSKKAADPTPNDHSYIRGKIENRGPCPGINSLANQGYLYVALFLYPNLRELTTYSQTSRCQEHHRCSSRDCIEDCSPHGQRTRQIPC